MDGALQKFVRQEIRRQQMTLDLIPSENVADPELLAVLGSPLTNKYSEGYPGKRYYPGNKFCDEIEKLAQERALSAFGLNADEWAVNVQPYSGSPANQAIYFALAKPGDTVMGLSLSHGGHLTHGHTVSFSGMHYHAVHYHVDEKSGVIDYSELEHLAKKHRPALIFSGATAHPRKIDFKRIGAAAKSVGAYHVADISHVAGLVAAGLHPSPFSASGGQTAADVVMMTTHKTLRGPRGAVVFSRNEKCKNRNGKLMVDEAIDRAVFPGLQGGPHNNVTAAIAWTFGKIKNQKSKIKNSFLNYQTQVVKNAQMLAEKLFRFGFSLVSGGTDTHLVLLDLKPQGITGSDAERALEASGILANRNTVPGDAQPFKPSGIRLGTPAVTSRGMGEEEMSQIALWIKEVLVGNVNVRDGVERMCKKFPLPYEM